MQDVRYSNPSDSPAQPMQSKRQQRRTITLDLPPQQILWLDRQASLALVSRSGFVRQLLAAAMQEQAEA